MILFVAPVISVIAFGVGLGGLHQAYGPNAGLLGFELFCFGCILGGTLWSHITQQAIDQADQALALANEVHGPVREEVRRFAVLMEIKLREIDHKGDCKGIPTVSIIRRIAEAIEEAQVEMKDQAAAEEAAERVTELAVDVANLAMMVADNARVRR